MVVALAVLLVGGVVAVGELSTRSAPGTSEGGWWSRDMESAESAGLTRSHLVFRCAPGRIEAVVDLAAHGPLPVVVDDVRIPLLDDLLGVDERAVRTQTEMMRDPLGDTDDLVPFVPTRLGGRGDWLRLALAWEVRECPQLHGGYLIGEQMEVDYRVLGFVRSTATLDLVVPFALTSAPLDELP